MITVVVYRNYEAGKQLVISSINGNDSLGGVDVLTRVDLRRKFQYFLFKSQNLTLNDQIKDMCIHCILHDMILAIMPMHRTVSPLLSFFMHIDLMNTAFKPVEVV